MNGLLKRTDTRTPNSLGAMRSKVFIIFMTLFMPLITISCQKEAHSLKEVDLQLIERGHLSRSQLIDYLKLRSLHGTHKSIERSVNYFFRPVFVCGIPMDLAISGDLDTSLGSSFHTYEFSTKDSFVNRYADSVWQEGTGTPSRFANTQMLSDTLHARLKREYGDFWIIPNGKLRYTILRESSNGVIQIHVDDSAYQERVMQLLKNYQGL